MTRDSHENARGWLGVSRRLGIFILFCLDLVSFNSMLDLLVVSASIGIRVFFPNHASFLCARMKKETFNRKFFRTAIHKSHPDTASGSADFELKCGLYSCSSSSMHPKHRNEDGLLAFRPLFAELTTSKVDVGLG